MALWMSNTMTKLYTITYAILALLVIVTAKSTRRKNGFKPSPMDFIFLCIAFILPNLPDERLKSLEMGLIAAKIIVLFFSYEVLKGELRNEKGKFKKVIVLVYIILFLRANV